MRLRNSFLKSLVVISEKMSFIFNKAGEVRSRFVFFRVPGPLSLYPVWQRPSLRLVLQFFLDEFWLYSIPSLQSYYSYPFRFRHFSIRVAKL
jgi:hypothetical protein